MALPMVHLIAALRFAQDKPELIENPDYYYGTISPDAIHIRDGNDKSRKDLIHYGNWRRPAPERVVEYWRSRFTPFDIGYGVHVLLDGQWATGFRRDFPGMLIDGKKPDPAIYYNDTLRCDFELYASTPQREHLFELIARGKAPEDHPMLTRAEFDAWREDTLHFYDRECPMKAPNRFITTEYIMRFLDGCTRMMEICYERTVENERDPKSDT